MYATGRNSKGKLEKNKRVKEGDCIFPFKYKWKEHSKCFDTELGKICATEINPKTRTLVKYGYCPSTPRKLSSTSSKTHKKKSPEKR